MAVPRQMTKPKPRNLKSVKKTDCDLKGKLEQRSGRNLDDATALSPFCCSCGRSEHWLKESLLWCSRKTRLVGAQVARFQFQIILTLAILSIHVCPPNLQQLAPDSRHSTGTNLKA